MNLNELKEEVRRLLDEKGFAYDPSTFYEKAALQHTEVSELVDVVKKNGFGAQDKIEDEVADIFIRAMNFALMFDIDVEKAILRKMEYNFKRPYRYNTKDET